jgi:histidine kinase
MAIPEHFQKYRLSNWEDELLGKPFIFTQTFLSPLELTLYFAQDQQQVGSIVFEVFRSMLVIFILASILIIVLVYFLGRSFLKPIVILIDSIKSVAAGDYSRTIENKRTDELGKANAAYNHMVSELRKAKMVEELWLESESSEKVDSSIEH